MRPARTRLGCQVIKELQQYLSLSDIALIEDVEGSVRPLVERMADPGGQPVVHPCSFSRAAQ